MKTEKLLSVIIPSYNMERYLQKCLGCFLITPESRERLEVIVVNDGSSDRTSEIAHKFAEAHPEVFRVIDKQNGNYGSCVNCGLKEAKGEFVKILDADDCYESEGIESLLSFLKKTNADLVLTDWIDVWESENREVRNGWNMRCDAEVPVEEFLRSNRSAVMFGLTYRSSLFSKLNYKQLEGVSYTDLEWSNLPLMAVERVAYLPKVVYRYNVARVGQTSNRATKRKNYWMILKMFLHLVSQYESFRPALKKERLSLLDMRLASKVESFYRQGHVLGAKVDFAKFDKELAALSPEIYRLAGTFERGRLHFNFVANFRDGSALAQIKIACYCVLVSLKEAYRN